MRLKYSTAHLERARVASGEQTLEEVTGGVCVCGRAGQAEDGVDTRQLRKQRAVGCREPNTARGICGRPGHRATEALLGPSCFEAHSHLTSTAVTCSGSLCHRPVMRVDGKLWFISMEPEAL